MNIGIVIQNNYPSDRAIRKRKFATSIGASGHRPVVFARNTRQDPAQIEIEQDFRPREEDLDHATVSRFSWGAGTPLHSLITLPVPFNPFWVLWLIIQFKRYDIQIVIVSGVRIGLPTILAARLHGIPVVLDLAENFTELSKTVSKDSLTDYLVFNPILTRFMETATIRFSDKVWVVVEERKSQLQKKGVGRTKVDVVSNTPVIEAAAGNSRSTDEITSEFDASAFNLVYVGVINEFRGLDLILSAMAWIEQNSNESVHLTVAGDGPYLDQLKRRCNRMGVADRVTFLGWIDSGSIPALLTAGDVGVIPHDVNGFTNTTIPNKIFDYMLAELPVLATDMDPVSRIIRSADCGEVIPGEASEEAVANIILKMKSSPRLGEMGKNGYRAVMDTYNWQREEKQLLESIQELSQAT